MKIIVNLRIKYFSTFFLNFESNFKLFIDPFIAQRVQQLRKKLIHSRNKTKFGGKLVF